MTPWSERPAELANLLNPAFCGFLIRSAAVNYTEIEPKGMPFVLTFLVLPLVLHRGTRDALPRNVTTTLIAWLESNPEVRVEFDAMVRSLAPFTREAVAFLMQHELLSFAADGTLLPGDSPLATTQAAITRVSRGSAETTLCVNKAQFVGRWFAQSGGAATVYSLFGIRP